MDRFIYYHMVILKPMIQCMDKYTQQSSPILRDYLDSLYCDMDVPSLWVIALSKKLEIDWKAPSDDLSETASEAE